MGWVLLLNLVSFQAVLVTLTMTGMWTARTWPCLPHIFEKRIVTLDPPAKVILIMMAIGTVVTLPFSQRISAARIARRHSLLVLGLDR